MARRVLMLLGSPPTSPGRSRAGYVPALFLGQTCSDPQRSFVTPCSFFLLPFIFPAFVASPTCCFSKDDVLDERPARLALSLLEAAYFCCSCPNQPSSFFLHHDAMLRGRLACPFRFSAAEPPFRSRRRFIFFLSKKPPIRAFVVGNNHAPSFLSLFHSLEVHSLILRFVFRKVVIPHGFPILSPPLAAGMFIAIHPPTLLFFMTERVHGSSSFDPIDGWLSPYPGRSISRGLALRSPCSLLRPVFSYFFPHSYMPSGVFFFFHMRSSTPVFFPTPISAAQ